MRFVVLHHTNWPGHPDHYDLMLQTEPGRSDDDPVLKTFATMTDDFPNPSSQCVLCQIQAHRRAYLQFEGQISGGRGIVTRVDEGELMQLETAPDPAQLNFTLAGQRLRGKLQLICMPTGEYRLNQQYS